MEYKINDIFWTFQGEGRNAGMRALFIRLPFCNYSCPWCDTEYNSFKKILEEDLIDIINEEKSRFCVITGGEPTMNKQLDSLVTLLKANGFYIACESNGSFAPHPGINWLTVSPKRYVQKGLPEFYIQKDAKVLASEFKYVVDKDFDFKILDIHNENPNDFVCLYLSPEYTDFKENMEKIFAYIKDYPHWKYSLQTHKVLEIK